jgi:pimeloyl-ACP methyl ester carboxylesterase
MGGTEKAAATPVIKKFRTILLVLASVATVLYVGLCSYLFVEQRKMLYFPPPTKLTDPPPSSGYRTLDVTVPGVGVIEDWWMPPASAEKPTVVFFHGNASDRTSFLALGAILQRQGWGAVLASYPGYSGNPGSPSEATLLADARATLAAIAPGPIIVWGHSLGSGVAARMASEGRAAGLVLESPYTSLPDVAAGLYPYIAVHWLMLDRFDTKVLVDKITVPVLIFHGADDPQVPFAMGRELADALGKRATLVRLEGVGHYPHQIDLSDTVIQWTKDHCVAAAVCRKAPSVSQTGGN